MNKNMTIEDLAIMLQEEFKNIYKRLDCIEERLDRIEVRLERIEFNQTTQERRISNLEDKVRIISTKLGLA